MSINRLKYVLISYIFLMAWSSTAIALDCHPKINAQLPQYLVGYGSLIDEQSKLKTDPAAGKSTPAVIKGYQRRWGVHGTLPGLNTTFLSVTEDPSSSFNGVIFKLNHPESIYQYDKREGIYCRKQLKDVQLPYSLTLPAQKQIWIYYSTQKTPQPPSADFPIVQSYVDIFIRGCIQIEQQFKIAHFAKHCVTSTSQWSAYWENDRIFPRRPFIYEPFAPQIDTLLKEVLPEVFAKIKPAANS